MAFAISSAFLIIGVGSDVPVGAGVSVGTWLVEGSDAAGAAGVGAAKAAF